MIEQLASNLAHLREGHHYRQRRRRESATAPVMTFAGRSLLTFCSNDYLGLASHPALAEALCRGAERYGVGSGAAHLISGHTAAHQQLEEELAAFTGRPRALLFGSGYLANLGVLTALLGRKDALFEDRLNHASLIDGAQLSRATLRRYPHNDLATLRRLLAESRAPLRLVASDALFSMDGDSAPLGELAALCREQQAWLLVDDAHGFGLLGTQGAGSLEAQRLSSAEVPILMATLGKALGCYGAFVAGAEELIETLIQRARPYIYTTALPPALAEAALAALHLVREEPWRRHHLAALIARFRQGAAPLGLPLLPSDSAIQPLLAGSAERALRWSRWLEQRGILVTAIRPPTVPQGSARLRITLSAAHSEQQIDHLLECLAELPLEAE